MKNKHAYLLAFIGLSLLLLYPSYQYGIVTDFLNWIHRYQSGNFGDIINCFNYPGLHQFFHLINYSFYLLAGTNHFTWYVLFAMLHGLNAYLVFKLSTKLLNHFKTPTRHELTALIIGILFLIYPYNLEAVIWKACLHYLIVTFLMLNGLLLTVRYFRSPRTKLLIYIHLLFVLSLFTLELSFSFPLITLAFIIFQKYGLSKERFWSNIRLLFIPQVLILAFYLLLTRLSLGSYIGHYGADQHLILSSDLILGNAWKYFCKNICFSHFWTFNLKSTLYNSLGTVIVYGSMTLASLLILLVGLFKWKNISSFIRLSGFQLVLFFIALSPIITLFFSWVLLFENDRYGYFASIFFLGSLVCLISGIKSAWIRYGLLISYSALCLFFFVKVVTYAHQAGHLEKQLVQNFNFEIHEGEIFILGIPDNYQGLYLFRDYENQAAFLKKSLAFYEHKTPISKLIDVAQFNAMSPQDSIVVLLKDDGAFHVLFGQTRNWFWQKGIGLSSYETEDYKVEKKKGYYQLNIKDKKPNQLFIYPQGGKWKHMTWPDSIFIK